MTTFLDDIVRRIMEGKEDEITEKQIQLATFYELKSLNDKVFDLEKKIDFTSDTAMELHKKLEEASIDRIEKLQIRIEALERTKAAQNGVKDSIPIVASVVSVITAIGTAFFVFFKHFGK
jgi:hypothetical protein